MVALPFLFVMALSGVWPLSSAGAMGDPEPRPSRGPKPTERSCSRGEPREEDGDNRPSRGHGLGYRQRSAATVQPSAISGGGSQRDCRDDEPRGAASAGDEHADDRRPAPGPSGSSERRAPGSPSSGSPRGSPPVPGSGAGSGAASAGPSGGTSQALDNGGSRVGGDTNAGGAGSAGPSGRPGSAGTSGGPSAGGGRSPGSAGAGNGGSKRAPSGGTSQGPGRGSGGSQRAPGGGTGRGPGGGIGGPSGFRMTGPPGGRDRVGGGVGVGIAWASLRAPGAALMRTSFAALPSTRAGVASGRAAPIGTAGPLPRTGGEATPSAVLALVLLMSGWVLRRSGAAGPQVNSAG
jgi:hypothetical protein